MSIIIGIGGQKGAGKDTAAHALVTKHGFTRLAFADPLKELCALAFDMSEYDLHDPIKKETKFARPFVVTEEYAKALGQELQELFPTMVSDSEAAAVEADILGKQFNTPREILQYIGTDSVRNNIRDAFWLDVLSKKVENKDKVVITDMRFPNERLLVRGLGGKLVLIKRGEQKPAGTHASENSLGEESSYDLVISNNGSRDQLESIIQEYYQCLEENVTYPRKERGIIARLIGFLKTLI